MSLLLHNLGAFPKRKKWGFQLSGPPCFVALLHVPDVLMKHGHIAVVSFFVQPSRLSIFEKSLRSPYQPSLRVIWRRPLVWTVADVPAQPSHPLSLSLFYRSLFSHAFFGARYVFFFAETSERRFGFRCWAQGPKRCALNPALWFSGLV